MTDPARLPPLVRTVWAVAGGLLAVLIALADRYGPHRDELYFAAAGDRLAWGYPDQPSLTPALARAMSTLAPDSLVALRLPSAVAMASVVVITALCARELGGRARAQLLAAIITATSVLTVVLGHLLSTATFDTLAWSVITWLALRALLRPSPRTWLAVGVVAGFALENKTLVLALLATLGVGILLAPDARRHLRSPYLWVGGLIAVALWLPNLAWQAAHDWPQLALAGDIQDEYGVIGERIAYVGLQLVQVSPLAAPLWIYGVIRLFRDDRWRAARPVAWSYVLLAAIFLVVGGKAYYLAGLMPVLVAAGSVALADRWSSSRLRGAGIALAGAGVVGWPIGLPILPVDWWARSPYPAVAEDQAETVAWPRFVATVRSVVDDHEAAMIMTGNYGEAGALEWYGVDVPVYSGHNGYGDWGPPPGDLGPVVAVGYRDVADHLLGCREVARIDNALDLENEEQGAPVLLCDRPAGTWSEVWQRLVHLSA